MFSNKINIFKDWDGIRQLHGGSSFISAREVRQIFVNHLAFLPDDTEQLKNGTFSNYRGRKVFNVHAVLWRFPTQTQRKKKKKYVDLFLPHLAKQAF